MYINEGREVFIVVDKFRYAWKLQDTEIAIDTVLGLGDYIEVEYKGENVTDIDSIIGVLHSVMEQIGAQVGEEDCGGYGFKLIQKKCSM